MYSQQRCNINNWYWYSKKSPKQIIIGILKKKKKSIKYFAKTILLDIV